MDISKMDYDEYKKQFQTQEEFEENLGKLSEEEARELIGENTSWEYLQDKMLVTWRRAHRIATGETWVRKDMMEKFDESWTLDDYKEIIRICLMDYCTWPEYWEDSDFVNRRIEKEEKYIREEYKNHTVPSDTAVEVGFSCG